MLFVYQITHWLFYVIHVYFCYSFIIYLFIIHLLINVYAYIIWCQMSLSYVFCCILMMSMLFSATSTHLKWDLVMYCLHCPILNTVFLLSLCCFCSSTLRWRHMGAIASQITSLMIVYSAVYSDADQRKRQSSASLAFVRGIHRGPVNSPHKWSVTRKMLPFEDVIMNYQILRVPFISASEAEL